MKKLLFSIGLTILSVSLYAQKLDFSKLENWAAVLKQAKAENKFIFLDGMATWCKPCKMMDEKVYSYREVGKLMNDKFLSVKVQIDKTDTDDEYTKSWYRDAEMLNIKYHLSALPALVFLSPDGELLYRSFGFQDASMFMETAKFAMSPEASGFKKQVEAYKAGKRDYPSLPKLIGKMRDLLVEDSLGNMMVKDYFSNYLNKLIVKEEVLTKENAQLIGANPGIVSSKDKFFIELMNTPFNEADKLIDWKGGSLALLENLVKKEELYLKLFKKGQVTIAKPDWKKFETTIKVKYPQVDAKKVIGEFGVAGFPFLNEGFYLKTKDWKRYNEYFNNAVKLHTQNKDWAGINNVCWYDYFCKVTDKASLERALKWADDFIPKYMAEPETSLLTLTGFIDTKASLVYKLGRRKEAMAIEQSAVDMLRADNLQKGRKEYQFCGNLLKVIDTMKEGKKLYDGEVGTVVYPENWKLLN